MGFNSAFKGLKCLQYSMGFEVFMDVEVRVWSTIYLWYLAKTGRYKYCDRTCCLCFTFRAEVRGNRVFRNVSNHPEDHSLNIVIPIILTNMNASYSRIKSAEQSVCIEQQFCQYMSMVVKHAFLPWKNKTYTFLISCIPCTKFYKYTIPLFTKCRVSSLT